LAYKSKPYRVPIRSGRFVNRTVCTKFHQTINAC
jgi:hypothetical protein